MQKYYQTLSKEKKNTIKEKYKEEYQNSDIYARLTRLKIYALTSFIMAIIIVVLSFIFEDKHLTSILTALILLIAAFVFLIGEHKIKLTLLNKIALKNK